MIRKLLTEGWTFRVKGTVKEVFQKTGPWRERTNVSWEAITEGHSTSTTLEKKEGVI